MSQCNCNGKCGVKLSKIFELQQELRNKIKQINPNSLNNKAGENIYHLLQALRQEISEAQDSINWKWWAVEGKKNLFNIDNIEHLKVELIDILFFLMECYLELGMDSNEVYDIYKKKWDVNMERQKNKYSVKNKTEEDNIKIENEIRRNNEKK